MMRRSSVIFQMIGLVGVLTGSLVLSCLVGGVLEHASSGPVMITGSLG
jgi:hypothetical protein